MQKLNNRVVAYSHELAINGTAIHLTNNTLEILNEDSGLDSAIDTLQLEDIVYGLYQRDHIPFILIRLGELQYDFPINAYDLLPSRNRYQLSYYRGKVSFIIIKRNTNLIEIERNFCFNNHFVVHLRSCLYRQWKYYHSEFDVIKKIRELDFLSTEDMLQNCKLYKLRIDS